MSTFLVEHHEPAHNQNVTAQRLAASREEVILLSHLLQAAWVVEQDNPVRRAITLHWDLVRTVLVILVIMLSIAVGLLAPSISHALGM
jgi:hypothetical protein